MPCTHWTMWVFMRQCASLQTQSMRANGCGHSTFQQSAQGCTVASIQGRDFVFRD
jgi:hypothetical protein